MELSFVTDLLNFDFNIYLFANVGVKIFPQYQLLFLQDALLCGVKNLRKPNLTNKILFVNKKSLPKVSM